MKKLISLLFLCLMTMSLGAYADDMQSASLLIKQIDSTHSDFLWKRPVKGDRTVDLDIVVDGQSQKDHANMLSSVIPGAYVQQWTIERENGLKGLQLDINGLTKYQVDVIVRIEDAENNIISRVLNVSDHQLKLADEFKSDNVMTAYVKLGIEHILEGYDHLLFILCLIFIARTPKKIVMTISGFTIAHSITLIMSSMGMMNISIAPVEASIALSIVFLAYEIASNKTDSLTFKYPLLVSSSFGLLHGFGFSSVLSEIGLPHNEELMALVSFNVGVEIGQVIFVAASYLFIQLITKKLTLVSNTMVRNSISYFCGVTSMFWLIQRVIAF
ncbi:HupE/UreJ family protein [Vibrio apostichopi]|uniref:HupE/UreJ family protein n=1 Tax=Vibrio apostichopi TaxID=3035453 RepID=UPI002573DC5C|nr:HupE/UreJ family protein [Vibrio sp. FE10]